MRRTRRGCSAWCASAAELRAGLAYAAGSAPVRAALVLVALLSLLGMPYTVRMPDIAARALGGGPHTLGWLMTAAGAGALGAAAYLAQWRTVVGLGRVMALFTTAFLGTAPLGSLLPGALAARLGTGETVALCGAGVLAAGVWFARALPGLRAAVRPIYVEQGLLAAAER